MANRVLVFFLTIVSTSLLITSGAPSAHASGPDPSAAFPPDGAPRVLLANAVMWYRFEYNGDRSPVEVTLSADAVDTISFTVYTPEQVALWRSGGELKGVGELARSGGSPSDDLVWRGNFKSGGSYYVAVQNGMNNAILQRLSVIGSSVYLPAAPLAVTLSPTPELNSLDTTSRPLTPGPFIPRVGSAYTFRLPILMYHHLFYLQAGASNLWWELTVSPAAFEGQVAYLARAGFHTITFGQWDEYNRGARALPVNPIILTFDDGWRDHYTVAYPILKKYGMVGTFFAPTNYIGSSPGTLRWEEVWEMSANGMEFGSHSMSHPFLTSLSADRAWSEIYNSKHILETRLRQPVAAFAYPYGSYNNLVSNMVEQAGYGFGIGAWGGIYQNSAALYRLNRLGVPYWWDLNTFAAQVWR